MSLFEGYTYTCIGCIIKQSKHPGNSDTARDMNYNKSKNKVVKMLIVLVCAFTLCWYVYMILNSTKENSFYKFCFI